MTSHTVEQECAERLDKDKSSSLTRRDYNCTSGIVIRMQYTPLVLHMDSFAPTPLVRNIADNYRSYKSAQEPDAGEIQARKMHIQRCSCDKNYQHFDYLCVCGEMRRRQNDRETVHDENVIQEWEKFI